MPEPRHLSALSRGQALGRYLIVEEVGRGAMGQVYRAHDTALDRIVAVKVLTSAHAESVKESIAVREGQMLAKVRHPNVIAVYDVGVAEGIPFIALEYVDGSPLSRWAQEHEPGAATLISMLHRLCAGLVAVHAAGLVHRDIKPANILVDAQGEPHLADLGLAKLDSDAARGVKRPVGTRGFIAPELLVGEGATPAADVYSLCKSIERVMPGESSESARRLRALLERGTSVEVDRRPSAEELHQLTRPPSRRARPVAVGMLGMLAGAGGLYVWMSQPHPRCGAPDTSLAGVWDASRRADVRTAIVGTGHPAAADTWSRVGAELDAYAQSWTSAYARTCENASAVREDPVAERTLRCLGRRRIELRALVDALASIEGGGVLRAARAVESLQSPAECAEVEPLEDVDPIEDAEVLGKLASAHSLTELGRFDEGRALADAVLASEGLPPVLRGRAWFHRGEAELTLGQDASALASFREAQLVLAVARDPKLEAWTTKSMIDAFLALGRPDDARHWLRVATALAQERDAATWDLVYREGLLAAQENELVQAAALFERSLEASGVVARSQEHVIRNELANVQMRLHRYEAAEAQFRLAHASCIELLGPHHPYATAILGGIASALHQQGKLDEATELLQQVLDEFVLTVGTSHPFYAVALGNLGRAERARGRLEAAKRRYTEATKVWRAIEGPQGVDVVQAWFERAVTHARAGRGERAEEILDMLEREKSEAFRDDVSLQSLLAHYRAEALLVQGDAEAALEQALSARTLSTEAHGVEHQQTYAAIARQAEALVELGRHVEALAELEPILEPMLPASEFIDPVAWAHFTAARALEGRGDLDAGRRSARTALELLGDRDRILAERIEAWLQAR